MFRQIVDKLKQNKLMIVVALVVILTTVFLLKSKKQNEPFTVSRLNRELVFFAMKGCGPCKNFTPTWELLVQNYGNNDYIELKKVYADEKPELVSKYGVMKFSGLLSKQ